MESTQEHPTYYNFIELEKTRGAPIDDDFILNETEIQYRKFTKSCDQLLLIDNKVRQLQVRYDRAAKRGKQSFRYKIRLDLSAMRGLKCMMYEYAMMQAAKVEELKAKAQTLPIFTNTDDDDSEYEIISDDDDVDMYE